MMENQGNSVIFYWHFTEDGVSKTGLTVTADVYEVARDGTATLVVDDGSCVAVGAGIYRYLLASGTVDAAAEYIAVAHTATDTVDAQDIPAMWVIDRAGTEKLDTGVTLADDAITASKFDESTAFPLKSADTGITQVARVGADSDTLETLSDEIAAVKAETAAILVDTGTTLDTKINTIDGIVDDILVDTSTTLDGKLNTIDTNVDSILADTGTDGVKIASGELSTVATASSITALDGKIDTIDNFLDTEIADILADTNEIQAELADGGRTDLLIDAIKAKTDSLPASPAPANEYDTELTAIQADLDNPDQYKADVSALATTAHVQEVEDKVDTADTVADAIKLKTDQLVFTTPNKVDASATIDPTGLATSADLAVVDENVDAIKEKTDQLTFTEAGSVDATATATVDTSGVAGDVWSYKIRTLTNQGSSATTPAEGDPLEIYRDTTVYITLTGIGATTGYTKIWFTVKEDLEDADTDAILQIDTTDKLKYIDGEAGTSTDGLLVIDSEEETADITLLQASAQLLPVYTAYPAFWDLKMLNDGVVSLLSTGEIYIYSTPTRSIS